MLHSCTMAVDVYHKINQFEAGNMLIRTPLNGDQYVHPSIIPSENACPEHIFLPMAQSGSSFTQRVPLGKMCAVAMNRVYKSKAKVVAELYIKSLFSNYI